MNAREDMKSLLGQVEALDKKEPKRQEELLLHAQLVIQGRLTSSGYDYSALCEENGTQLQDKAKAEAGLAILQRNKQALIASDTPDGRAFLVNTIEFLLCSTLRR